MGLWSRFFRWRSDPHTPPAAAGEPNSAAEPASNTVELPAEPFVFECQLCGKVFEARRKRPQCPECDGAAVLLLSG